MYRKSEYAYGQRHLTSQYNHLLGKNELASHHQHSAPAHPFSQIKNASKPTARKARGARPLNFLIQPGSAILIQISVQTVQGFRRGTRKETGDQSVNEACDGSEQQPRRKATSC
jgi:hypothetical protein